MWHRSKQPNWVRLLKQVELSKLEDLEYDVPRLRFKSYYDTVGNGICYDRPYRNIERSWKSHRKTQYK